MKPFRKKIAVLAGISILLCALFLLYNLGPGTAYALERRGYKIATMIVVACCVAYSSVIFQTITNNKILTPSIMGFEAVYLLFQTVIVFIYGDKTFQVLTHSNNFFISVVLMVLFALGLFAVLFRKRHRNLYLMLLMGLVLGTLFSTLSSFMQILIDPNEFLMVEGQMFASFNRINFDLFWYAFGLMGITFIVGWRYMKYLDVLALGRENAINLGVDYNRTVRVYLVLIAVLVSVSTALVGPITFLGILVTNLTYELFRTFRHRTLILSCCLVSVIAVVGGQFVVEHLFRFNTVISIIINFIGGIYFIYLLLRTRKI
ncbi:iron chelate uptake ABC transporter family permease subunit [Sinomicrobium soli]|uniref:iron chelate uptake ABC transporter family permease subunit n=1 Tax=Sinomicrobium sp. N-1-3-6 TaxID=2219864 RepID=UPI000DCC2FBF|nr:iron chelate uptake ABC transporter family permease subunit [Sinomicrobium sp. N-1-3-6]RAV27556.1 iron ABC transporter permease [Sinomicrobium sp. N-1-3-6]